MLFHHFLLNFSDTEQIVLKTLEQEYTLSEVKKTSYQLANFLHSNYHLKRGDIVMLIQENSFEALVCQIAISICGAVFVPVSPNEPKARVTQMIDQFEPVLAVGRNDSSVRSSIDIPYFSIYHELPVIRASEIIFDEDNSSANENDIAYIISTSGTTGVPKGIMMTHKATIAFFKAIVDHCQLDKTDNVGSISPLQFDFSILDLGLALGSRACLTILPQALAYKPQKFLKTIIQKRITQMNSVPSIWSMLLDHQLEDVSKLTNLKSILYAGEKFPIANMRLLQEQLPKLKIVNCFGQSESIACTFYDIPNPLPRNIKEVPIGKVYKGSHCYIIDEEGREIDKPNVIGEMWLSNPSLFEGYWNNKVETDERLFKGAVSMPSVKGKIFKTGDLVFKDDVDNLYFVGRKDRQIKKMGNRVELQEISNCITSHSAVREVFISSLQADSNVLILAFIIFNKGVQIDEIEIRKFCRESLPSYMVPEAIIIRHVFPLTSNGKVDEKEMIDEYLSNKSTMLAK